MTIWKFAYNTLFPKIGEKGKRFENVKRQWCNVTLGRWFWAIKTCPRQVNFQNMSVWLPDWVSNFFILKIFFDKMVSFLINIIQHEQYIFCCMLVSLKVMPHHA